MTFTDPLEQVRIRRCQLVNNVQYTKADERVSAQGVAGLALILLATAAVLLFLLDLTSCRRTYRVLRRNVRIRPLKTNASE